MSKRRRETWTFQPDDAVIGMVERVFGRKLGRGERTQLINEALRFNYPQASLLMAEKEVDEANARLERLRKIVERINRSLPAPESRTGGAPESPGEKRETKPLNPDDIASTMTKRGIAAGDNREVSSRKHLSDEESERVDERHAKRNDPPK